MTLNWHKCKLRRVTEMLLH